MFDMDGVLADFMSGFTKIAHDMFGYAECRTENQVRWDFDHMKDTHVAAIWKEIKSSRTFWATLPSLISGNEHLRLADLCVERDVYFVTARPGLQARRQTSEWLNQYDIDDPAVIVLPTLATKGEMANALGASYSIEDKAGNAVCISYMSEAKSYLIDRPHNRFNPVALGSKVRRVTSVSQYLDDIEEGK